MALDDDCDGSCSWLGSPGIELVTHEEIERQLLSDIRYSISDIHAFQVPDYILYRLGMKKLEDCGFYNG